MILTRFIRHLGWQGVFAVACAAWLALNWGQALLTEIMPDEAYYLLYGGRMAWGYFDHPPAVAAMTCLSRLLFGEGNMSVRFVTIILQFLTLMVVWKIADERQPSVPKVLAFFAISASMIMFAAYGFVTAPDVPLLFFAAVFLFFYKRWLKNGSLLNTLAIALAAAAMIYSKYHALLVIGAVVCSNPRLLVRRRAWAAAAIAALLLTPHLLWHIEAGFPSFQYHILDRGGGFRWKYVWEYPLNQLVVFNPFAIAAMGYVLRKRRARDVFEKSLHFLTIGTLAFFWLTSLKGHVEPHWTAVCTIPMIVLLYRQSVEDRQMLMFVKKFITPAIVLVMAARVALVVPHSARALGFAGRAAKYEALGKIVARETERQRDRETERQRDRETERQRCCP